MAVGAGILLAVTGGVVGLWFGWRHVPGPAGELLGMAVGLMSTPFILEFSFFLLGCAILLAIHLVRRRLEGDEFVSLDELESRDRPSAPAHRQP
jgi:hypothetical protein